MSDDLGPGDVVEATRDLMPTLQTPFIPAGSRSVVVSVDGVHRCDTCGVGRVGLSLADWPVRGGGFLDCSWRKVGGSRADTVARFSEDLTVGVPELEGV